MAQLYHHPLSAASRTIRLMMAEYDLPLELTQENLWERREEFLALNPAATLPVLMVEEEPLVGAFAIGEYLDETEGVLKRDRRLFPEDPLQRAEMRRLVSWALEKFEAEVTRYVVHEKVTKRQMPAELGGGAPD
ncbi:MAG: glutathione S-transferase family protein, partial [Pseudomonadota bacterium]